MAKATGLVEDEKKFRCGAKDYLRMNGYTVDLCENGEDGIRMFKQNKL